MRLRQRLDNLPVGRKLLAALLVLLAAVLLVANLAFISAAYWITQESMAPQALHTLARLIASPALSKEALHSPASAQALLKRLDEYAPLRAAVIYDSNGTSLAQLQRGEKLQLPEQLSELQNWRNTAFRNSGQNQSDVESCGSMAYSADSYRWTLNDAPVYTGDWLVLLR